MIVKIFYSLVLFPNLRYQDQTKSGFFLIDIIEKNFGIIEAIFSNGKNNYSIFFTHIDFVDIKNNFTTKNWKLTSENLILLNEIYSIINESDIFDFNFFKPKDFYYKKPFGTVLNITSKCNLFCDYCFNDYDYPLDTRNSRKTLGLEDFKKIIDELYNAGTRDIILTGGEPFSCIFLWELLDYLKLKNIFVRINTNGTLLFDSTLERLNSNYSIHFMVSMHEFNNKDYYELNKKGASNIYGISELKKWETKYENKIIQLKKIKNFKNLTLGFLTILTPKNILYLEKIYSYMLSNFSINDWHFFRLFSTGTTNGISREMITLAIAKLYKLNKYYKTDFKIVDAVPFCVTKNIDIASKVIDGELSSNHNVKTIITAEGNIQIMSAFDMHLGNIFENGIKKVWEGDFVQKKLTNGFLPKECFDCYYKNECMGGSRMDANIYNGSYDALDPLSNIVNKKNMTKEILEKIKSYNSQFIKKDLLSLYLKKQIFFKNIMKNIKILGTKSENIENINNIFDRLKKIENIYIDDRGKDVYYKTRSVGCTYCTLGKGCTVVLSYKCHRDCFFCYEETPLNPKVKIDPYNDSDMAKIYKIIDDSFSNPSNKTLAVTGGEPFLFIDKVYEIFEYVNKKYPGKHKRIYTTGEFFNDEKLNKLKSLGLDELRISIKPGEEPNISGYKLAKKYVKYVLIEMPVMPNSKEYMIDILTKIDNEKCIDGINLNELTFNNLNLDKYKSNNLKLDLPNDEKEIYHRYYDISKVEIGIYGSKLLALELMEYFSEKKANFFMHYCDLDTVSYHHFIYKKDSAISKKLDFSYITKYGLHKILRVYGDLNKIENILLDNNVHLYKKGLNYYDLSIDNVSNFLDFEKAIIYKNHDYLYDVDFELINI